MLFNSYDFILYFFPACLLLSLLIRKLAPFRLYIAFLAAASLLFYAQNNFSYLFIILFSILGNYILAGHIERAKKRSRKALLFAGVSANLALLVFFKYTNFVVEQFNAISDHTFLFSVALPIGISFYTFQQIMYLVDTYKQQVVKHDFLSYALYISFFPQLIAGPIVHQKAFLEQFYNSHIQKNLFENLSIGLSFFFFGLFKKVVIADTIGSAFVDPVFKQSLTGDISFWEAWVGSIAYAFQIYYDFSGYSDMAFGLAKCFGIELPINFNSPYKSKSLREFWRRWHITLSFFLRDYLFIPLGGSRVKAYRKHINLVVTMFLAGLWHGAGWGFMLWGFLHGIGLSINHMIKDKLPCNIPKLLFWAVTFSFICLTWVPFRAETLSSTFALWSAMFDLSALFDVKSTLYDAKLVLLLPLLLAHCIFFPNLFEVFSQKLRYSGLQANSVIPKFLNKKWKPSIVWALLAALAFYLSFLMLGNVNSFIYFQF